MKRHGLSGTRIHSIWKGMKKRCTYQKYIQFGNYGGRGITVCDEWADDFMSFYNWSMENGYSDNVTLDRIDANGNYEPSNCRWATMTEQARNKRTFNNTGKSGVYEINNRYISTIKHNKKSIWIGTYNTLEEAIQARNNKEIELWT